MVPRRTRSWYALMVSVLLPCACTGAGDAAHDTATDARLDAADALPDASLDGLLIPDFGTDAGCSHTSCAYLQAHYRGFQPSREECWQLFAPATGCTMCCKTGWGGQMVAVQWCCPDDDASDATEVVADP